MSKIKGQFSPPLPFPQPVKPDFAIGLATAAVTVAETAAFALKLNDFSAFPADDNVPYGNSPMGGRIYPITLGADSADGTNTYTDAQGNEGSYKTIELDCAIVEAVDFNNKVVVTNIQGLPYSNKEFISNGDNDITITGIFNSVQGMAPVDFIANMKAIFNAPVPIPVTNYYLNLLGIYYIVIMPGTTMGQMKGGYATQMFTIKAISDVPMTELLP